jgi:GINS complex subunit 3
MVFWKTFHQRLVDVMDQAQHFGGSADSVGASSRSGDTGGDFREGLEATERECKSTCYYLLRMLNYVPFYSVFSLAQESTSRTKSWYESTDKKR